MKQVIQIMRTGEIQVAEAPTPIVQSNSVLVRTLFSAISAGTEKTKIDTGKKSLIGKALARPDLAKKVIEKMKRDGLLSTYELVKKRLEEPSPLGYSSVGIVEEVGDWVEGISPGDLVACAGAGYANHAEYNVIPSRLVAKCPPETPLKEAAFCTIGSIALQGLRQTEPKLGERIVVVGLGLIGQILCKLLTLNGCEVFGIDLDSWKIELAKKEKAIQNGALANSPTLHEMIKEWTHGWGADAVVLSASTPSDEPITLAGKLCREKGRVIILGAVGTKFPREDYYIKELDIRISRSYGPGRYDPLYEELGLDYPYGYVRFTEQRNMETFLSLLAQKRLNLSSLLTHEFEISNAEKAFALLSQGQTAEKYMGILLSYSNSTESKEKAPTQNLRDTHPTQAGLNVSFIGLGNYASGTLIPALKKIDGVNLNGLATASGISAQKKGELFGFKNIFKDSTELLENKETQTVFIATRHQSHAELTTQALNQGKNVFVEKPLCLNQEGLEKVQQAYLSQTGILTVGFNRRFAPLTLEAKKHFEQNPNHILFRVNAGILPPHHWLNLPEVGGGRILGECCHFIDFIAHMGGALVSQVHAFPFYENEKQSPLSIENVHVSIKLENGTLGTLIYLNSGTTSIGKEWVELHGQGTSLVIDDFRTLTVNGKSAKKLSSIDKGQRELVNRFTHACLLNDRAHSPIPTESLWNSTAATLAVIESIKTGQSVLLSRHGKS